MTSRTMAGSIAALVLAVHGSTFAFGQGTDQQREACTPDAFRLCGQYIPDAGRVETCLRNAGPRLSPQCRVVFNPPQQTSPTPPPTSVRERGQRDRAPLTLAPPADHDDDDD